MKVRQRLRRARYYTGKGWRKGDEEGAGWNERQIQRGTKERTNERRGGREVGGWYVWAGSRQGGSGSAAGGEIMGADEPESKH